MMQRNPSELIKIRIRIITNFNVCLGRLSIAEYPSSKSWAPCKIDGQPYLLTNFEYMLYGRLNE
jgi:hypothetical protein